MKESGNYLGGSPGAVRCGRIFFPLQSGCDRILARMGRRYRTADFRSKMLSFPSYRSAHVELTQDIDLSNLQDAADSWTPIGTNQYPFTGVFDGRDFTISGLVINIESSSHSDVYAGLFGYVNDDTEYGGNRGVVKNVNVADAKINVTVTGDAYTYAGVIAGRCNGDISGCSSGGTVTVTTTRNYRVGGIVGYIQNYGDVTDCENTASIQVTETGNDYWSAGVGGIAGYASNVNNIVNCKNGGTVKGGARSSAGGIAGYFDYNWNYYGDKNAYKAVTLNGCENRGNVTGNRAGGIAGQISNDVDEAALVRLTSCMNSEEVKGIGDGSYAGGIVGYVEDNSAVKLESCSATGKVTGDGETATCGGIAGCLGSGAAITADPATTWDKASNPTLTEIGSDLNYTTTEHIITATAYEGGTISPSGEFPVTDGEKQKFTVKANEGYVIETVTADGQAIAEAAGKTEYTFEITVTKSQTVSATFKLSGGTTPDDGGTTPDSGGGGGGCSAGFGALALLALVPLALKRRK